MGLVFVGKEGKAMLAALWVNVHEGLWIFFWRCWGYMTADSVLSADKVYYHELARESRLNRIHGIYA